MSGEGGLGPDAHCWKLVESRDARDSGRQAGMFITHAVATWNSDTVGAVAAFEQTKPRHKIYFLKAFPVVLSIVESWGVLGTGL